jgi:hypothetical protein
VIAALPSNLHPTLARYAQTGYREVEGWVFPGVFTWVQWVHEIQTALGAAEHGGAAEIGVHHGRFFLLLNQLCAASSQSLALDVFADQHLNIDGSGQGDREAFERNLRAFDAHAGAQTQIVQADSLTHDFSTWRQRIKLMSIDGGHTVAHTLHDLRTAEQLLTPAGALFVDDIMHPEWPGVFEGVLRYLDSHPSLVPVAMGHNKMLMVRLSYLRAFQNGFVQGAQRDQQPLKWVQLCGHPVLAAPPIDLRASTHA